MSDAPPGPQLYRPLDKPRAVKGVRSSTTISSPEDTSGSHIALSGPVAEGRLGASGPHAVTVNSDPATHPRRPCRTTAAESRGGPEYLPASGQERHAEGDVHVHRDGRGAGASQESLVSSGCGPRGDDSWSGACMGVHDGGASRHSTDGAGLGGSGARARGGVDTGAARTGAPPMAATDGRGLAGAVAVEVPVCEGAEAVGGAPITLTGSGSQGASGGEGMEGGGGDKVRSDGGAGGDEAGHGWLGRVRELASRLMQALVNPPTIALMVGVCIAVVTPLRNLLFTEEDVSGGNGAGDGVGGTPLVNGTVGAVEAGEAAGGNEAELEVVTDAVARMGAAMVPSLLINLGSALYQGPGGTDVSWRAIAVLVVIRLMALPVLGTLCVQGAKGAGIWSTDDPLFELVLLLQHAMPSALNLYTLAAMHCNHDKVIAAMLFWQYMACVVTIPVCVASFLAIIR